MKQGLEGGGGGGGPDPAFFSPPELQEMYGTEHRFNEILITNTIQKRNRKIYLDITNKCEHVIKDECQTEQQG